jgi:hypothetical protein
MNGWQRIGLVAFAIWALVAPVLAWNDIHDQWSRLYQSRLSGCRASYDAAYKDKAEAYSRCFKEAADKFRAESDEATRYFWRTLWEVALFAITIPALVVWGLISLAIVAVRWIRKGFAEPADMPKLEL